MTPEEGRKAVELARQTLDGHVEGRPDKAPGALAGIFAEPRGVFVTLNIAGSAGEKLRGCIGFPYPTMALGKAIREATMAAASEDPRFVPVAPGELPSIVVEVSVLTPPAEVKASDRRTLPSLIRIGTDGLIVSNSFTSGLLLPQVATEYSLDQSEFLSQTCLKAGLPADAWLSQDTTVQVFQAEVFAEATPHGRIARTNPRGN